MRYVSLLEFQPSLVADITPPSSYLETTNGSLSPESCRLMIDENGFMVTENSYQNGDLKVLLLGGSSIENLYIPQSRRVMTRIEDLFAETVRRTKVYNAAISNAHLLHNINILLNKGIGIRPDFVIYYPTSGLDIIANEVDNAFWNPTASMTPVKKSGSGEITIDWPEAYSNKNEFEDEKKLLRTLFDICGNFNIKLCVSTWPLYGFYDEYIQSRQPNKQLFEEEDAQTALLNVVVREICNEKQGILIDLEATFSKIDRTKYFYDWNHLNIDGCELVAKITSLAIQSHQSKSI